MKHLLPAVKATNTEVMHFPFIPYSSSRLYWFHFLKRKRCKLFFDFWSFNLNTFYLLLSLPTVRFIQKIMKFLKGNFLRLCRSRQHFGSFESENSVKNSVRTSPCYHRFFSWRLSKIGKSIIASSPEMMERQSSFVCLSPSITDFSWVGAGEYREAKFDDCTNALSFTQEILSSWWADATRNKPPASFTIKDGDRGDTAIKIKSYLFGGNRRI